MTPKIAANIIVKASDASEAKSLAVMLESIRNHVDTIYIQLNAPKNRPINKQIREVAEKFTKPQFISTYEWNNNFVDARNNLLARTDKKYDWIVWFDTDDIVENPEMIRPSLAVMPDNVRGVFVLYDYQKDDFGNVIVAHWNTRAVRNDGSYAWKSSFEDKEIAVHETLVSKREARQVANNEWKVVHMASGEKLRDSLVRNLELLEGMAERQAQTPQGIDPRILFYLGSHHYDAHNYEKAREFFINYLQRSGWAEERAEAHVYMGKLFTMHDEPQKAKTAFLMALGEYPENPGAYLGLGKLESETERWAQAASWFKRGIDVKRKLTSMVRYNYDWELYTSYANALSQLGGKNLREALKMAEKAYKLRPFDEISKNNRDNILNLLSHRDDMRAVARLVRELSDKEEDKIVPFLDALPSKLDDSIVVIDARQQYSEVKVWPKKSIALYVGQGPLGSWGPWSLKDGIGGSEEAVIRLSNELIKLEWEVTVFATPGKRTGNHGGVIWKQYWEFNTRDKFDVLICWRQTQFFDHKFTARKKYLWLHDVIPKEEFIPTRLKNLDKVIVLSKYHRSIIPNVPDKQIFLSSNGITPTDFIVPAEGRDPHRMIYMSSHVRGLALIYEMWPDIKKAIPDATLDIYYGWGSYIAINRDNPERMVWRRQMIDKAKELDGVTDRGKVGQDIIVDEIFKSGIWIYPCPFPEISCITALKAQAGGAIPISSNFAALDETVQFGVKIPMKAMIEGEAGRWDDKEIDKFKREVIKMLKDTKKQQDIRPKMMEWARQQSWEKVAKQWDKEMM